MVGIANGLAIICLGLIHTGSDHHTGAAQRDRSPHRLRLTTVQAGSSATTE